MLKCKQLFFAKQNYAFVAKHSIYGRYKYFKNKYLKSCIFLISIKKRDSAEHIL